MRLKDTPQQFRADIRCAIDYLNSIGIREVYLFGSRARGTNRDDSDYDIFILKSGIENERVVTRAVNKALFRGHIYDEIDLIAANPEKFEKHKDNRYLVYKDINDQGVSIYG